MSGPFARSTRTLDADGVRGVGLLLAIAVALLVAWAAWFMLARIAVYEVSDQARVEVEQAVYPVQSRSQGRVMATHLAVGRDVQAGNLLVELDSDEEALRLTEEQTRYAALQPQIEALEAEATAEEAALGAARHAAAAALAQQRSQLAEAEPHARLADDEAARLVRLRANGLVPEVDELRARAESERRRALAQSLRLAVERLERSHQTEENDRKIRVLRLRGEGTRLRGVAVTTSSLIRRLENEIERRRLRAPVSGRLGEVAELRIGSFVAEGDTVGTVIPAGRLRVVAEFSPSSALGRIAPGQAARLRLAGFPWTEYGTIAAVVDTVASEVRSGTVRVEMALRADGASAVPFQHGLPGSVEVEVERVAPALLVLRAAGRMITRPVAANTPRG